IIADHSAELLEYLGLGAGSPERQCANPHDKNQERRQTKDAIERKRCSHAWSFPPVPLIESGLKEIDNPSHGCVAATGGPEPTLCSAVIRRRITQSQTYRLVHGLTSRGDWRRRLTIRRGRLSLLGCRLGFNQTQLL